MRRLILILTVLLLGATLTAQNISRCEYWFDEDYAARQVVLYTADSLPSQVDATGLSAGLHSLVLLVQDTNGVWSSPRSFTFLHYPTPQTATATYTYWFDQNHTGSQSGTLAGGNMMVDASMLTAGPHFLAVVCQIGNDIRVEQHLFYHFPDVASAPATYTCWFDQNYAAAQTDSLVNGTLTVDASSLAPGMHQFTIVCDVGNSRRVQQHLFYKTPDISPVTLNYRVDGGQWTSVSTPVAGAVVDLNLDMTALEEGTHSIEHYATGANNDVLTVIQIDTFERTHMPVHYTLTAVASDSTMGSVTGGGSWIENEYVTITAIPAVDHHFLYWNDGDTVNPRVVTLTSDTTFIAYFAEDTHYYDITVLVAPGNENMGSVTGSGTWMEGEQVTIEAIPVDGFHFLYWNDGDTANPRVVILTSDTTFTAYFEEDIHFYTLTLLSADTAMGYVSEGGVWAEGEPVTIEAYPIDGYHFTQWNDGNTANPRVVTLTSDTTFTAYFAEDIHYYTVTVLSADETMGTVTGSGTWMEGEQVTITAIPNAEHYFTHWNDGDTVNPRVITLTSDTTFTAYFAKHEVGIDEHQTEHILAYGNHGNVIVSLEVSKPIWIYDIKGRLMYHQPTSCNAVYSFPVPSGVYIVKIGDTHVRKVVVKD